MFQKIKNFIKDRKNQKKYFKWLVGITSPYAVSLILLVLIRCGVTLVGVANAAVNKYIVDMASASAEMTLYIVIAVLFSVFSIVASVFLSIYSIRLTEKFSFHIRSRLYDDILDTTWIDRTSYHSEGLVSRLTSDANAISNGIITISVEIVSTIIQFVSAFLLIWHYDTTLACVALLTGPVAAVASVVVGVKMKKVQVRIQQSEADYREFLQENISHADVIKIFGREKESAKTLEFLHANRFYWIKKKNMYNVLASTVISIVFSGSYLFAFISGALKISSGQITYGTMTAFLSLMAQVQSPIYMLASLLPQCVGVLASAGRVVEISQMQHEVLNQKANTLSSPLGLRIKNASLSYADDVVIKDLSLDVKPGSIVMISGSSGIGKTTLIRSILGFLQPKQGVEEFYDNEGNSIICSADTRRYISYVPQGNTLFSGTIASNLKMANPDATEEDMIMALKNACAWDFVKDLPNKLDTLVGEKGYGISEGQAQRISIARAFLKPYEFLIMDEATSALDEDVEREILTNLRNVNKGKTCLFVSHRKSVSEFADEVIKIG